MRKLFQRYLLYKKQGTSTVPLWFKISLPVIGFIALVWFLVRVIPKPSRAAYPCQRIAFPLASGFVVWLIGLFGSVKFLVKAKERLAAQKIFSAACLFLMSVGILWVCMSITSNRTLKADQPIPNNPIGDARGIYPGRVVWIHDPNATDWVGSGVWGQYSWQPEHTSQPNVDAMIAKSIRELSGGSTDGQAWDLIFRYFNQHQDKGDVGYVSGEKITIKINLTTCNADHAGWTFNSTTHEKINYLDKSDTSPQMIIGLLRQLVFKAGVNPSDIAVGDTLCIFPKQWWDICHTEFPDVTYFDPTGNLGREESTPSTVRQHWSTSAAAGKSLDYVPQLYAQADYLINLAVLKSHERGGITLCAKNHYGSYNRRPNASGYLDLHSSLANESTTNGQYRGLVDIMGHPDVGGKTLLYMLDGLYGGEGWAGTPSKFTNEPFNNDWPSSVLVSQDPVAIDSVGLDILWQQWPAMVQIAAAEDYLIEAAMADAPPSGTFYDPNDDTVGLSSLGVYERWNNAADRQYSRNLDPVNGTGIELVYVKMQYREGDINSDQYVDVMDLIQLAEMWLWVGDLPGQIPEDIHPDGQIDLLDFSVFSQSWKN